MGSQSLPHEAYRYPCANPHCRNLSTVEGEHCCRRCYDAHRSLPRRVVAPYGERGHEQACAHAAQCHRGLPGYIQIGDEARCDRCQAWHPVVLFSGSCVYYCGHVVTDVGKVGAPYLAGMVRRRAPPAVAAL